MLLYFYMSKDAELNRTSFLFTAPNERAQAIELVAVNYPEEDLAVEVAPIRTEADMTSALAQTIMRMRVSWNHLSPETQSAMTQRYMRLAENGDSSLVKLEVPGGAQDFDWQGFYGQVEAYL